jgi:HAD superfamily hydrolase (TIGR01549 family)
LIIKNPKAFEKRPACVLLDFDNTLYDYASCNNAGMEAARRLAQRVLNLAPGDFDQCFADARTELKARLGRTASSHSRLLYFQRTVERAGFGSQPFVVLQLEQAFWREYLDVAVLYPEALDFLDDLRSAGIPSVLVTDLTAQIQMRKMILLGLDRSIEWIVSSEETGADKPSPLAFELALAKLGGVEGPVWFIGDDIDCDLAGAKAAVGAVTLLKTTDGVKPPASPDVDAAFSDFGKLRKLFAGTAI